MAAPDRHLHHRGRAADPRDPRRRTARRRRPARAQQPAAAIEQAAEVEDFLRDKFTNHALYLYHQRETAALYRQAYELALETARQAERAFNLERGQTAEPFIEGELWDDLHQGLLAGERLEIALRRMEKRLPATATAASTS